MAFEDVEAERNVLAGIFRHGQDAFLDVNDIITAESFTDDTNRIVYACVADHYGRDETRPVDFQTLMSVAGRLKLAESLGREDDIRHVRSLMKTRIELSTVRPEAEKLLKFDVAREGYARLGDAARSLRKINGSETLSHITSLIEDPLTEYVASINEDRYQGPRHIAEGGREWFREILENPGRSIGIPSPFPEFNRQIGGGFRAGTVSLIAARLKVGKTVLSDTFCLHAAGKLGIPVFNVDTEMSAEQHLARILANITKIPSNRIEGVEGPPLTSEEIEKVDRAFDWLESIPYQYESVVDRSFSEQLASMRRWARKNVTEDEKGRKSPALVVYDYLQMSDASEFKQDFQEHQLLGFNMLSLQRMAHVHGVSAVSFIQLNRLGEELESATAIAGSDMPARKAANISIFKKKSPPEIARDGIHNGTHKLINTDARHGPGGRGNYISMIFDGATSSIQEGQTFAKIMKDSDGKASTESTFDRPKKGSRAGGKKTPEAATVKALTESVSSDSSVF